MVLEFENIYGIKRKIAEVSSEAEALKEIKKKFLNKTNSSHIT